MAQQLERRGVDLAIVEKLNSRHFCLGQAQFEASFFCSAAYGVIVEYGYKSHREWVEH